MDEALQLLDPFKPEFVYLFGSFSIGAAREDSDLDLAFWPGLETTPVDLFGVANQMAGLVGREVDLVDLSRCSTVMAKEVYRTGKILQEHNQRARVQFEMLTLSNYARLNEERRACLAS